MLTEMVTANILPASFEVTVSNASALEKIYQNYATKTDIVDEISVHVFHLYCEPKPPHQQR